MKHYFPVSLVACLPALATSFVHPLPSQTHVSQSARFAVSDEGDVTSRRNFFGSMATVSALIFFEPAVAADPQLEKDKANILKGYQRLTYLLDNWEKETTVCKTAVDSFSKACERTPIKVMDYLGYKATNDPLFKADKTMLRLYTLVSNEDSGDYIEAVERYTENADEASGMAFISSWGEANPGGGKDRVELFIERARKNVVTAQESLGVVVKTLDLKP